MPIVVVAALAATPAVSQAAPHYYRNGVLIPEGVKVPILAWGKVTWEAAPKGIALTCANVGGGYVENPGGGGASIGAIGDFASYDCESAECPAAGLIEIEGKEYEKVFEITYPPQSLPWASVLTEAEVGKTRTHMSEVVMTLGCYATPLTRAEMERKTTGGPGEDELFPLAATVTCVTTSPEYEDELKPLDENGTSAASPSRLVFDTKAGALSCAGGAFEGRPLKSLKVIGYSASELITVKNP